MSSATITVVNAPKHVSDSFAICMRILDKKAAGEASLEDAQLFTEHQRWANSTPELAAALTARMQELVAASGIKMPAHVAPKKPAYDMELSRKVLLYLGQFLSDYHENYGVVAPSTYTLVRFFGECCAQPRTGNSTRSWPAEIKPKNFQPKDVKTESVDWDYVMHDLNAAYECYRG